MHQIKSVRLAKCPLFSFVVPLAVLAFLSPVWVAVGQCTGPDQIDYDFTLTTLDLTIPGFLPAWTSQNVWQQVQCQTGPSFDGADNDCNGIDDDDHFDLLAAVVDGTPVSLVGVPQANIDEVRSAFAFNAATVVTIEFTIPRVKISAYGLTVYDGPISTNSTLSIVGQTVQIPSLWALLEDQSPVFKKALVDLLAGYMTIGEDNTVNHLRSLLQVLIGRFITDVLPGLLNNLKDTQEAALVADAIKQEIQKSGGSLGDQPKADSDAGSTLNEKCSPNIDVTVNVSGVDARIQINGCDLDQGVTNFINNFNCTKFRCRPAILGSAGDLNGDGTTNGASYTNAGRNRQAWMALEGIINPPLEITTQPSNTTVDAGDPATLSFAFVPGHAGATVSYQWDLTNLNDFLSNGVVSTGPTLSFEYAVPANSGVYTVTVCDDLWKRRSAPATLTVNPRAFAIVEQPVGNDNLIPDESYTLSVRVVGGAAVPGYQWQFDDGSGFVNIGGNSRQLTLSPLALSDTGFYRCLISGNDGTNPVVLTSDTVHLTVLDVLRFAQHPVGGGIYVGDSFTFTVAIAGPVVGTAHFVWSKDGVDIPDTDSPTFTIDSATLDDAGEYRCRVFDDVDSRTSRPATLIVAEHLAIVDQPVGGTGFEGNSYTFTVGVTGGLGTITYQWYHDGNPIPGANGPSLTLNPLLNTDAGEYYVVVADDFESVTSDTVTLIVAPPFFFDVQPQGARKYVGDSHTFTVEVSGGTPPFHYQWKRNGVDVGEDSNTLVLSPLTLADNGTYVCVVSDQLGFSSSAPAVLEVAEHMSFSVQPQNTAAYVGSSASFTVVVTGGLGTINYVWKKGTTVIPVNSPTLTFGSVTTFNAGTYTCEASDDFETIVSDPATLTVAQPVSFTQQPRDLYSFVGGSVTFTVSVTGGLGTYHYQWFHNGTAVGTDSANLTLANVQCSDAGTYYVEVTDDVGTTRSNDGSLTVFEPLPDAGVNVNANLDGAQVVPPVTTDAMGVGVGTLAPASPGNTSQFTLSMSIVHTVTSPNGASINRGVFGSNGPVIFNLGTGEGAIGVFRTLTNAQAAELVAGNWYVLIKSTTFPSGEIRGQITTTASNVGCQPEGEGEGVTEGSTEGVTEGTVEGVVEGSTEGTTEGTVEGVVEGSTEGTVEGTVEGSTEGTVEGVVEGSTEGTVEGTVEGSTEGTVEGTVEGSAEGTVEGTTEGIVEGSVEGTAEGTTEGEGSVEGEGGPDRSRHSADQNNDGLISLSELLRAIQFFNSGGYRCAVPPSSTEDGYVPGTVGDQSCVPHSSDYNPQDWRIGLSELLRLIQFFNAGGYHYCPGAGTEDGYCVGRA